MMKGIICKKCFHAKTRLATYPQIIDLSAELAQHGVELKIPNAVTKRFTEKPGPHRIYYCRHPAKYTTRLYLVIPPTDHDCELKET